MYNLGCKAKNLMILVYLITVLRYVTRKIKMKNVRLKNFGSTESEFKIKHEAAENPLPETGSRSVQENTLD